jgi:hypothetical protein
MTYKKDLKNKILLLVISLFLIFVIIEVSLRLIKPQPTLSSLKGMIGTYYAPSNFNTFELKKNYTGTEPSMERQKERVSVTTNKDGLRNTYQAKNAKNDIVIMGDSYTFGVYVNDNDTYPSVLSKLLEKEGRPYNVHNAGYASGFSTDEQYAWLNNYYINNNRCPQFVILGLFTGNDILGIDEEKWGEKDEYGLPLSTFNEDIVVTENGYLKNKKRSAITVGTQFIYKIPVINNLHSFIFAGKILDRIINVIFKKRGYGYSSDFFYHYYGNYNKKFLKKEKQMFDLIEVMKIKLEKCGSNFIVINIPINFIIDPKFLKVLPDDKIFKNKESIYHKRLEEKMINKNINFINITKMMLKDYNLDKNVDFYPENGEVHFNENGNYYVGEKIKDFIINNFDKNHQKNDESLLIILENI